MLGVKKLSIGVLILAGFILFLAIFVVPSQGGLQSSTEIRASDLEAADPQYESELPLQEVGPGNQARSIFIAVVMLSHVLFANLHLGGSWVAVITESLGIKTKKSRFTLLGKSITLFNVILFSFGATFAIAGMLFFISLFPAFAKQAFHIYWWPLFFEAITFAAEIFFLYTYWFSWGKISHKWHQFLGYGYAIVVFIQTLLINTLAAGMLTPGATEIKWGSPGIFTMPFGEFMKFWDNPTLWRLQFHRLFAAISYFGFILAILAVFHYLDKKELSAKKYWDWVTSYGIAFGLLGLIMQPAFGLMYMFAIFDNNSSAFMMIMHGPRGWEFLLMVSLFSALIMTVIVYFIDRREPILSREENKNLKTLFNIFLIVVGIAAFFLVQPAWFNATFIDDAGAIANPLGVMDFKYVAIFTMALVGALMLMLDTIMLSQHKEGEWGNLSKVSRYAASFAGILGMWIVVVMGYARESARSPWTIFGIVPVPGGQTHPTPISISRIFVVWAVITTFALGVFWFTSKVTAHHPEKAEKI